MIRRLMAHRVYDPVIRESAPLRYPFAADDAAIAFGDERAARVWLEGARWPDGPGCPRCATPSRRVTADPDGRYWCGSCRRRFHVRTGTALERRRAPLRAWAVGAALSTNGPFVVRPEALRETCGITTGASRDVADGLRAACGGIVCPYDRPERLAGLRHPLREPQDEIVAMHPLRRVDQVADQCQGESVPASERSDPTRHVAPPNRQWPQRLPSTLRIPFSLSLPSRLRCSGTSRRCCRSSAFLPSGRRQESPLRSVPPCRAAHRCRACTETPRRAQQITPLTAFSAPRCASEHNNRRFRSGSCFLAIFI